MQKEGWFLQHTPREVTNPVNEVLLHNVCHRFREPHLLYVDENAAVLYVIVATIMSRDSSAAIATRYGLDGPGLKSRWV